MYTNVRRYRDSLRSAFASGDDLDWECTHDQEAVLLLTYGPATFRRIYAIANRYL